MMAGSCSDVLWLKPVPDLQQEFLMVHGDDAEADWVRLGRPLWKAGLAPCLAPTPQRACSQTQLECSPTQPACLRLAAPEQARAWRRARGRAGSRLWRRMPVTLPSRAAGWAAPPPWPAWTPALSRSATLLSACCAALQASGGSASC